MALKQPPRDLAADDVAQAKLRFGKKDLDWSPILTGPRAQITCEPLHDFVVLGLGQGTAIQRNDVGCVYTIRGAFGLMQG